MVDEEIRTMLACDTSEQHDKIKDLTCPNCGSKQITMDPFNGQYVCSKCLTTLN